MCDFLEEIARHKLFRLISWRKSPATKLFRLISLRKSLATNFFGSFPQEREFGVRIKPAENFYGSPTKTFLEMPTTLLQVPRRTFRRLRVLPQVSRNLLWRLRVLPQVSRRLLWRLRESRKSRGVCLGVCGYSRKSRGIYFGVCGSPASLAAFALAFAGVPQVFRRTCWPLQHAINDILI